MHDFRSAPELGTFWLKPCEQEL
jgi:hypothetical protein